MKINTHISALALLLLLIGACEKDTVEPVGLFEANYYTSPNEDQTFNYYYDDGELVAGGLDEYLVSIRSQAGTFNSEELLLLKYTAEMGSLADSLVPFTYFTGMSYKGSLNQEVEYRINYLYPYNNAAHADNEEYQFFLSRIDEMLLVELEFEAGADIYYDPNFTSSVLNYTVDQQNNEIVFNTSHPSSLFALCWPEEAWKDTLMLDIPGSGSNVQEAIYGGTRSTAVNPQGATYVSKDVLYLKYNDLSFVEESSSSADGWKIKEINIAVQNPVQGSIAHEQVQFDVLIGKPDGGFYEYTHLLLHPSTNIEILNWPDYREYGIIRFDGPIYLESTLAAQNTTLEIKFKRQR